MTEVDEQPSLASDTSVGVSKRRLGVTGISDLVMELFAGAQAAFFIGDSANAC